jgi:hypothetical protein
MRRGHGIAALTASRPDSAPLLVVLGFGVASALGAGRRALTLPQPGLVRFLYMAGTGTTAPAVGVGVGPVVGRPAEFVGANPGASMSLGIISGAAP